MKSIQKIILCGALPFLFATGAAQAEGGGIGLSGTYVTPPNWEMMDKMAPEQRSKAISIHQKMMAMEMEHREAMMKMEMQYEHAMMDLQNQLLDLYKGH